MEGRSGNLKSETVHQTGVTPKPGLERNGRPVHEAKVVAFFVRPEYRRRGIGRRLKQSAFSWAGDLECYQVRERSCYSNIENHTLNISMGFGMQPAVNEDEGDCSAYFMLPVNALMSEAAS